MTFTVKETIQTMIDCNAGMIFYYKYSQPELKRIAHPVSIKGNNVICMMQDGFTKSFKIDGINFPESEKRINEWEKDLNDDSDDIDDEMTESDSDSEEVINQFKDFSSKLLRSSAFSVGNNVSESLNLDNEGLGTLASLSKMLGGEKFVCLAGHDDIDMKDIPYIDMEKSNKYK
jgi:hypothetical protein